MDNKRKTVTLAMSAFLLLFYISIIMYVFFFIVQIDTFQNFIAGMVFKVIGFSILAVLILGNILTSAIKTGYFVPMLIIAIMYNIILDIFNIFGIMAVSSGFFTFLHFILLFIFCLLSIPMYIMGKR